ncbi:MAG: fumarate hydratase [Coriobacteriales bacterium]|jgi:tartrate/fumarate subfamily iron-sulfur-dependent hydro-lyase alpha chain|nr:fumarate hydratase [Coriobacteriales bacterium]
MYPSPVEYNDRMEKTVDRLDSATIARLVGEAIAHIACELRPDVLAALERARQEEGDARGQVILGQLIENAHIAARDRVPLCQDTGTVWVLLEVGEACVVSADVFSKVDAAVAEAYRACGLRMSLARDALVDRQNTGDNTPAFCELSFVQGLGHGARLHVMLKGGGSDNASRIVMLEPGAGMAGVRRAVLEAVVEKGANACPPLILGIGVGATFDKVAGLSKRALLREVGSNNPVPALDVFEHSVLAALKATDVGPGGFGGQTTALAAHVLTAPCHIATLPVAINLCCSALRSHSMFLSCEA